jgi:hypothetical protein
MINGWDETLTGPFRPRVGFDYCIICSGCNFGPFKCTDPEGDQGERFGIQKMVISSSPTIAQDARVSAQLGTCLINHPVCRSTTIGGRTIHNRVYILSPLPPKFQSYWCLQSKAANERNKSNPWGLTWRHTTATSKFRGPGENYRLCIWGLINLSIYL